MQGNSLKQNILKTIYSDDFLSKNHPNKINLKIIPVKKKLQREILNTIATFLSGSIGNGDELVDIYIQFEFDSFESRKFKFNNKPLIRNTLDYHQTIKEARSAICDLKSIIK